MAESVNGGGNQPSKPVSMERNLLLAFLLAGLVMFVSNYFIPQQPPAKKPAGVTQTSAPPAPAPAPATAAPESGAPAASAAPATRQQVQSPLVIENELYRVVLSNQGGTVRSWQLKKWKGNDNKPLELLNTASGLEYPFSLYFPANKPAANVNWAWYKQTVDPDNLGVTYEYSDGHVNVRKVLRFQKNSYLLMVSSEVTLDGQPLPHLIQWRGGFGDLTVAAPSANQRTFYFDVPNNKLVEMSVKDAAKGPITSTGQFSFGGIADNYFAAVFLSEGAGNMRMVSFADTVPTALSQKPEMFSGVALGDGDANRFELFVGPKDINLLRTVNPKLEQAVDFGWLSVLAKPLFLLVNWVNNTLVHNFGWAIVLVTIVLNAALFPLRLGSMKSARKMQALKPQIDAIRDKVKGLPFTDPRAQEAKQKEMDLYKANGVNPMGGCIPLLIQMPFFFAFYQVFRVAVEMRGASWLWVHDLSQAEQLPIHILPIIKIASQFFMQQMTPQPAGVDPAQAKMMKFMPLMFGMFFYNLPSGLVLYYLTSNLVGMGLQWFFNKTAMADNAALAVAPPKKNGRK